MGICGADAPPGQRQEDRKTSGRAVIEWSNFTRGRNTLVRGTEWVEFDRDSGLIREIRAYLAAPLPRDLKQAQLEGFDYAARGYPVQ
jgi:hypothetical protein